MQDFVGVKGVVSPERLSELSQRSDWQALAQLASHWGALAANSWGLLVFWGTWWSLPLFVLQGVLLNFLYAPTHECDHLTAFRSRWLNIWIARLCGFVIFNPSDHHRWTHFTHHRNTQDWEKDTELERPPFRTAAQYLLALSGLPLIRFKLARIWRHAFVSGQEWYLSARQQRQVVSAARWHIAGYTLALVSALVFNSWWVLYFWWGPFFLMRWSYMLQGLAEHTGLTHRPETLLNTRTIRAGFFFRWVNWNMTYHCVHHTFPGVPFYRLPALHREVEKNLGFELPAIPYLALHWQQLRALLAGHTESDLCDAHEAELIVQGRLARILPSGD